MPGRVLRTVYRVYASAITLVVIFILFCPFIIIAPTLALRREIGRLCVRAALAAIFVPFRVRGLEHLPQDACVVVCNHASYLDGIVLTAALPRRFTFMVKDDAARWPYVGLVIKRMGVRFINRTSKREGAIQTRALIRDLSAGMSLAVFAEGTFRREPGLLAFQKGAFAIAAKAGAPVIPAAIRGTRHVLGGDNRLIHWSPIEVEFMPALQADGSGGGAIDLLRDEARAAVLAACREPDAKTCEAGRR